MANSAAASQGYNFAQDFSMGQSYPGLAIPAASSSQIAQEGSMGMASFQGQQHPGFQHTMQVCHLFLSTYA
jgi:hypothetical protein